MLHRRCSISIENDDEYALAIVFFSCYAKDHVEFRRYVLGQNLASLVSRLQMRTDANVERLCYAIHCLSRQAWIIPEMLQTGLCKVLLQALDLSYKQSAQANKTKYFIIGTIYNIVLKWEELGRRAIHDVLTSHHTDILLSLQDKSWTCGWMTELVQEWVPKILQKT